MGLYAVIVMLLKTCQSWFGINTSGLRVILWMLWVYRLLALSYVLYQTVFLFSALRRDTSLIDRCQIMMVKNGLQVGFGISSFLLSFLQPMYLLNVACFRITFRKGADRNGDAQT